MFPKITTTTHWNTDSVMRACIRNVLYTNGDNVEYAAMLDKVADSPNPTVYDLYAVARDIAEHSEDQTVANVMCILFNDAVTHSFELDDEEI